ncbi:MAG: hypothetical protein HYY18_00525 [Planctomycetes bacterium]|nr:hypothetical protein [Planctomycetota bacterium]
MSDDRLGVLSEVGVSVRDLPAEIAWFERLACRVVERGGDRWACVSDGHARYLVSEGTLPPACALFHARDPEIVRKRLDAMGIAATSADGGLAFSDPGGFPVRVLPLGSRAAAPAAAPPSLLGTFGECSWPVADARAAAAFWIRFGFRKLGGNWEDPKPEPYPYAVLSDGQLKIGLHAATDGRQGALIAYFNPDNPARIEKLRAAGVEVAGFPPRKPAPDAATVTSPGGLKLYLFPGDI